MNVLRRKRRAAALLLATATLTTAAEPPAAPDEPRRFELYFEVKLLVRSGAAKLDQWAGGRLLMEHARGAGAMRLVRPLEDPWTLRWYPRKHEVKLGAAVWVAEPAGHPYGTLARRMIPDAERRYHEWVAGEHAPRTAPFAPRWAERVDRFWAARHRRAPPDPLHEHPVYPFYVLGDPAGRLSFVVERSGAVRSSSIRQRMTRPWLAEGWEDWIAGARRPGYGFWEKERPAWEPHTYETLAAALGLLDWSPYPAEGEALSPGERYAAGTPAGGDGWSARLEQTVAALVPRARGRFDWSGSPGLQFRVNDSTPSRLAVTGESGWQAVAGDARARIRVWRHAAWSREARVPERDELQTLLERGEGGEVRLWLKVGYRPAEP